MNPSEFMPFLTGSRLYGAPRADSDLDLVVHMDRELIEKIAEELPTSVCGNRSCGAYGKDNPEFVVFRFGELNLIATACPVAYRAWQEGTANCVKALLKNRRGLTRDEAVDIIGKQLAKHRIDS